MKIMFLTVSLAAGLALPAAAEETLRLQLEPDRNLVLKGSPREIVLKIGLQAASKKDRHRVRRVPLNLAVVIDRSGSMTGSKIEKARQAAMQLVDCLDADDIFSLVAYSDRAEILVPAQRVRDAEALKKRIERLRAGGSTALHAGVSTGAEEVEEYLSSKRINRVILLSDGLANVGPSSTRDLRRLGRALSERGIAVTTIGVGDDYNEDLMAGLAEASDANYYYVRDTEKLPDIFAKEFGELINIAAREVRIEIACPEGVQPLGFIGRSERFENQRCTVKLSHFVPGQDRHLFLRCRLDGTTPDVATVSVAYLDEVGGGAERMTRARARIGLTSDRDAETRAVNAAIVAEKELLLAAVAKDEALIAADAGNYREAAQKLKDQAVVLQAHCDAAPAAVQVQMRSEVDNLLEQCERLEAGYYDASTRKTMQWESFNSRNAKSY